MSRSQSATDKRVEEVLDALVFDIAIAGFLDRQPPQRLALRLDSAGHGVDDGVHMPGVGAEELAVGVEGGFSHAPGGGDGFEVCVHQRPPGVSASKVRRASSMVSAVMPIVPRRRPAAAMSASRIAPVSEIMAWVCGTATPAS